MASCTISGEMVILLKTSFTMMVLEFFFFVRLFWVGCELFVKMKMICTFFSVIKCCVVDYIGCFFLGGGGGGEGLYR